MHVTYPLAYTCRNLTSQVTSGQVPVSESGVSVGQPGSSSGLF